MKKKLNYLSTLFLLIGCLFIFTACPPDSTPDNEEIGTSNEEIGTSIVGSWFAYDTSEAEEIGYYGTLIVLDKKGHIEYFWSEGSYFEQYSGKYSVSGGKLKMIFDNYKADSYLGREYVFMTNSEIKEQERNLFIEFEFSFTLTNNKLIVHGLGPDGGNVILMPSSLTSLPYHDSVTPPSSGNICSWCEGDGECSSKHCNYGVCIECGGKGYTYIMDPKLGQLKTTCVYCTAGKCTSCRGTGKCSKCKGTGRV